MNLSLTYHPDTLRTTANLMPIGDGRYETRHGFFQVVADNITRAFGWNDACVMELYGGVYVWHGNVFEDIVVSGEVDDDGSPIMLEAGLQFYGSRFQTLQSGGRREERIYIGNGSTIYYLSRNIFEGGAVTGVEVTPETLEILIGTTDTATAVLEPSWSLNTDVSWSTDEETIATVDDDGVITAVAEGTATITATTADGGFTDSCLVTVVPYVDVTGVEIDENTVGVEVQGDYQLTISVLPENATNTDLYWIVDDQNIVSVTGYGKLIGLAEGRTTVHAFTDDGDHTDSVDVVVVPENRLDDLTGRVNDLRTRFKELRTRYNEIKEKIDEHKEQQHPWRPSLTKHRSFGSTSQSVDPEEKFYKAVFFENEFVDGEGIPYPMPNARALATWRSRLWAADGTHIIYHCKNDNPNWWEPLDAIAIQSGTQSTVTGLCAMGNKLIVSTRESLWQIVGDSPYNWEFQSIVHGHGAINQHCLVTDGHRLFHLDRQGIYELGNPQPISKAIEEVFFAPDYEAQLLLDARGEYLYVLVTGRLFAYNTYTKEWGEIAFPYESPYPIRGLVMIGGEPGWYGDHGLWVRGARFAPDVFADGTRQPVVSRWRTWPVQPNLYGEAAINRTFMRVEGTYKGTLTYRIYEDQNGEPLSTQTFNVWENTPPEIVIREDPPQVVYNEQSDLRYIEVPLHHSHYQFEHEIETSGFVRMHRFDPQYHFTPRGSQ